MGGRTSAEMTPPTVSPICLMPMAMPRSRDGKRSTMALPSTGLTTLQPVPATTRQARKSQKRGAAAARREANGGEREAAEEGRTDAQAVGEVARAGSEKKSPGR